MAFFVFSSVARKLLEILEPIIEFEAGCVNLKSYLEVLKHMKRSDILCSHLVCKK